MERPHGKVVVGSLGVRIERLGPSDVAFVPLHPLELSLKVRTTRKYKPHLLL